MRARGRACWMPPPRGGPWCARRGGMALGVRGYITSFVCEEAGAYHHRQKVGHFLPVPHEQAPGVAFVVRSRPTPVPRSTAAKPACARRPAGKELCYEGGCGLQHSATPPPDTPSTAVVPRGGRGCRSRARSGHKNPGTARRGRHSVGGHGEACAAVFLVWGQFCVPCGFSQYLDNPREETGYLEPEQGRRARGVSPCAHDGGRQCAQQRHQT